MACEHKFIFFLEFLLECGSVLARRLDIARSCIITIVIALYLTITQKALELGMLDENLMILL